MPLEIDPIISLPGFRLLEMKHHASDIFELKAVYEGELKCPHCNSLKAWIRAKKLRSVRHESFGLRPCRLIFRDRQNKRTLESDQSAGLWVESQKIDGRGEFRAPGSCRR